MDFLIPGARLFNIDFKTWLSQKKNLAIAGGLLVLLLVTIMGVSLSPSDETSTPPATERRDAPLKEKKSQILAANMGISPPVREAQESSLTKAPEPASPSPVAEAPQQAPAVEQKTAETTVITAAPSSHRKREVAEERPHRRMSRRAARRWRKRHSRSTASFSPSHSEKVEHNENIEKPKKRPAEPIKPAKSLFGNDEPKKIPIRLSKDAIQAGMSRIASRVKKCSKKETRPIVMSVTISKNGNVANVAATGSFAGTEVGSCVARIVRSATFPKAQQAMTVKYPFHL